MRKHCTKIHAEVGYATLEHPIGVEGVGQHAQQAGTWSILTGAVAPQSGPVELCEFEAQVVPNSEVPALLGRRSLTNKRAVLDLVNNELHLCGPGPVALQLPLGSASYSLTVSRSGHLLLPFTEYGQVTAEAKSEFLQHKHNRHVFESTAAPRAAAGSE